MTKNNQTIKIICDLAKEENKTPDELLNDLIKLYKREKLLKEVISNYKSLI